MSDHAADRDVSDQGEEVEEALADMFAYDFDPADPTLGEDTLDHRVSRDWADPDSLPGTRGGPYPARMRDYRCPPSSEDPHHNSTILSHAYYLFEQEVGHFRAGKLLQYIPWFLSPQPRFIDVYSGFVQRAGELYPQDDPGDADNVPEVREAVHRAFRDEVGIGRDKPQGC
jgi:Zn-dependent metalloprotease